MATDLSTAPLAELLTPLFPADVAERGGWAWLAKVCDISRASVAGWLRDDRIPALRVDALCDLLAAPAEVRAELRRRAGFQVVRSDPAAVVEAV